MRNRVEYAFLQLFPYTVLLCPLTVISDNKPVHHDFYRVVLVAIHAHALRQLLNLSVHAHIDKPFLAGLFE